MTKEYLSKKKIPDKAGVYFFLGAKKEILYIGKATSLKNRVKSYFSNDISEKRSELIEKMVSEAKSIQYTITDSVLEALILETNLIRTHKPLYNTKSKDDKSYNHLIITKEEWPRILIVREKDIVEKFNKNDIQFDFGPFTNSTLFRDALKIIKKLFKFYDTETSVGKEKSKLAKSKIDFNKQIGLYPESDNKDEYQKTIKRLKMFFEGKKQKIIAELEKEMIFWAKKEEFEKAEFLKKKIFSLQHINDISLIKNDYKTFRSENNVRIEGFDVAHFGGKDIVGVMTVMENNEIAKNEYRKFKIKTLDDANDIAALKELLERRISHTEWPFPQIIVVDGALPQKNIAEKVLKTNNLTIPVVSVVKDEKHKPVRIIADKKTLAKYKEQILLINYEAHCFAIGFHRKLSRKNLLQ